MVGHSYTQELQEGRTEQELIDELQANGWSYVEARAFIETCRANLDRRRSRTRRDMATATVVKIALGAAIFLGGFYAYIWGMGGGGIRIQSVCLGGMLAGLYLLYQGWQDFSGPEEENE